MDICKFSNGFIRVTLKGTLTYSRYPLIISVLESDLCVYAATTGNLEILEWAQSIGSELHEDVFNAAAENGQLGALKWLKDSGCYWQPSIWESSARRKNKDVFIWLQENSFGSCDNEKCQHAAAKSGNLEVLRLLKTRGVKTHETQVFDAAVLGNHLEMIEWLLVDRDCNWTSDTTKNACLAGNFDLLKRSFDRGCPLNEFCSRNAALGGHFEILIWLVGNKCPVNHETTAAAARGGHFEILQWLFSYGCQMSGGTTIGAIERGRLDILQWAISNGCSLLEGVAIPTAAKYGHVHIMDWLWKNYRSKCSTTSVFLYAAEGGHLESLRWAKKHFCSWDSSTHRGAAKEGHLEALKWMKRNGMPWRGNIPDGLGANGHLRVLRWLIDNGAVKCDIATVSAAMRGGHLNFLTCLRKNGHWSKEHESSVLFYYSEYYLSDRPRIIRLVNSMQNK
jgi:hypothetical protein